MALKVTRKCLVYSVLAVIVGAAVIATALVLILRDDEEIMKSYKFANSDLVIQLQEQPDHRYVISLIRGKWMARQKLVKNLEVFKGASKIYF